MTGAGETRALGRRRTFIDHFAFRFGGDGESMSGEAVISDELRVPGTPQVRVSALATLADIVAGSLSSHAIAPRLTLTLDLGTEIVGEASGDRFAISATVLKAGRSTVVSEVEFRDAGSEALAAVSQLTFVPSPRPEDVIPPGMQPGASAGRFDEPWAEQVGARVVEPGVVEIDCRTFVTQLSGTLQGGIVALLAELAAETVAGAPVLGSQIRYLTSVRTGPARATARALGGGVVRVEVRDTGNDGRLASIAMLRTAPERGGP